MADNIAQNTFDGGINLDLNPLVTPNNVLTDCLNGTLFTFNGLDNTLLNDMGNAAINIQDSEEQVQLSDGFVPVGSCLFGGVLFIASHNPLTGLSEIGSFPSVVLKQEQQEKEVDFDLGNLIEKSSIIKDTGLLFQPGDEITRLEFSDNEETIKTLLDYKALTIEFLVLNANNSYITALDPITTSEEYTSYVNKKYLQDLISNLYIKYSFNKEALFGFNYYYYTPKKIGDSDNSDNLFIIINSDKISFDKAAYDNDVALSFNEITGSTKKYTAIKVEENTCRETSVVFKNVTLGDIKFEDIEFPIILDYEECNENTLALIDYQFSVNGLEVKFKVALQDIVNNKEIYKISTAKNTSDDKTLYIDIIKGSTKFNYYINDSIIPHDKLETNYSFGETKIDYQGCLYTRPFILTSFYNQYFDQNNYKDFYSLNISQNVELTSTHSYTTYDGDYSDVYESMLDCFNNKDDNGNMVSNCTRYATVSGKDAYLITPKLTYSTNLPYSTDEYSISYNSGTVLDNNTYIQQEDAHYEVIANSQLINKSILTLSNILPDTENNPNSQAFYNLFYPGVLFYGTHALKRSDSKKNRHAFSTFLCPFPDDKHYFVDNGRESLGCVTHYNKIIKYDSEITPSIKGTNFEELKEYTRSTEDTKYYDAQSGDSLNKTINVITLPNGYIQYGDLFYQNADSHVTFKSSDNTSNMQQLMNTNPYSLFVVGDITDYINPYYNQFINNNYQVGYACSYADPDDECNEDESKASWQHPKFKESVKLYFYLGKLPVDSFWDCVISTTTVEGETYNIYTTYNKTKSDVAFDFSIYGATTDEEGYSYKSNTNDSWFIDLYGEIGSGKLPGKSVNGKDISGPWNTVKTARNGNNYSKHESALVLFRDSQDSFTIPYFYTNIERVMPAWGRLWALIGAAIAVVGISVATWGVGAAVAAAAVPGIVSGMFISASIAGATISISTAAATAMADALVISLAAATTAAGAISAAISAATSDKKDAFVRGFKKHKFYDYCSYFSGNTISQDTINLTYEYEFNYPESADYKDVSEGLIQDYGDDINKFSFDKDNDRITYFNNLSNKLLTRVTISEDEDKKLKLGKTKGISNVTLKKALLNNEAPLQQVNGTYYYYPIWYRWNPTSETFNFTEELVLIPGTDNEGHIIYTRDDKGKIYIKKIDKLSKRFSFWETKCHYIAESLNLFDTTYYQSDVDDISTLWVPDIYKVTKTDSTNTSNALEKIAFKYSNLELNTYIEDTKDITSKRGKNLLLIPSSMENEIPFDPIKEDSFETTLKSNFSSLNTQLENLSAVIAKISDPNNSDISIYRIKDCYGNMLDTSTVYDTYQQSSMSVDEFYKKVLNKYSGDLSGDEIEEDDPENPYKLRDEYINKNKYSEIFSNGEFVPETLALNFINDLVSKEQDIRTSKDYVGTLNAIIKDYLDGNGKLDNFIQLDILYTGDFYTVDGGLTDDENLKYACVSVANILLEKLGWYKVMLTNNGGLKDILEDNREFNQEFINSNKLSLKPSSNFSVLEINDKNCLIPQSASIDSSISGTCETIVKSDNSQTNYNLKYHDSWLQLT